MDKWNNGATELPLDRTPESRSPRESEKLYRSLFENMLNGFAYCRMLFEDGKPLDFIYLAVNAAFESQTGLKNVVGKKVTEVIPGVRESDAPVFEIFGRVATTGRPERFEMFLQALQMWFSISVYSPEPEYFVAVFDVITERKQLEAELGQARKLEAVGQLAAGIAHEINTPTQYVGDGVHFLKEAFEGYRRLASQYRRALEVLHAVGGQEALVAEIRQTEQDIDLAYLEENVPGSFASCEDGISRISTIVRAMKEFAHPDQKEKVPANLNQALQTTLAIARNEYKYVADVITEFGDLPAVLCHVGDLNQVFLNLVVNAAHAIGDVVGQSGGKGTIRIRTSKEETFARIDIADTGAGIPEKIRQHVFEPFFTTKEVGKGTGQGLAIARSIVVTKHGGALTFESEVGKGTTFTIRLPIGEESNLGGID